MQRNGSRLKKTTEQQHLPRSNTRSDFMIQRLHPFFLSFLTSFRMKRSSGNLHYPFLKGPCPVPFRSIFAFSIQSKVKYQLSEDWIRTTNLCYQKRPLYRPLLLALFLGALFCRSKVESSLFID